MTRLILVATLCVIKFVVVLLTAASYLLIRKYERRDQATKGRRARWVESAAGEPPFSPAAAGVT
jgi:hypothetical protein